MTWQNKEEDVLGSFKSLPKRTLNHDAKERILHQLKLAEQTMERKRKKRVWTYTMASGFAVVCFAVIFSGVLQHSSSGMIGSGQTQREAANTLSQKNTNTTLLSPSRPTSQQQSLQIKTQIEQITEEAKTGKVPNVEFAADTSGIDQVEQQWGKADTTTEAGVGRYATYTKRNVAFGFNKGNQIFDVRSFDPNLKRLTYTDIISTLGAPDDIRYLSNQEQEIVVYKAGTLFELEWVFSSLSKQNLNPNLDHISVYCQKDAVNSMSAQ